MSHQRGRVHTVLQRMTQRQSTTEHAVTTIATTSTSFGDFGPLDTSTTGMFKIIILSFTYDICVYICLISQIMKIDYLISIRE